MSRFAPLRALRRFLAHRTTVLVLILAIVACVVLALLLPAAPIGWDEDSLLHYLSLEHADHLLTTYVFAVLLIAFIASLALTCWDQVGIAWRRTFAPDTRLTERSLAGSTRERLDWIARDAGFRPVRRAAGSTTYALHPWANWGSALLHLGLIVSLCAFLHYVMTERQGLVRLEEGEALPPGAPWADENRGLLAGPFPLPVGVRLERVVPVFREDDTLESLSAELVLLERGREVRHSISPNDSHYHLGYRLYHPGVVGHAFDVDATDAAGRSSRLTLHLPLPRSRWVAAYGNFDEAPFRPAELKAKYFLAADRGSMADHDPLLVLRLAERGQVLDEVQLRLGEKRRLGGVDVTLVGARRWTTVLFDAGTGMPPVLAGFFVMMLGALLLYGAVPRALTLRETDGGCVLGWRAFTREEELFRDELEGIVTRALAGGDA